MPRYLFLISIVMCSRLVFGQDPVLDSLNTIIETESDSEARVDALIQRAKHVRYQDLQQAYDDAHSAFELAESIDYRLGVAKGFYEIGVVYYIAGQFPTATDTLVLALNEFETLDEKEHISNTTHTLGVLLTNMGLYDSARVYLSKSLSLRKSLEKVEDVASSYLAIGLTFENQGEYNKAIDYYFDAIKILEKAGDRSDRLAGAYLNTGEIYRYQQNLDKALTYYDKSQEIFEELGNKRGLALCYHNKGNVYDAKEQFDKALDFNQKALALRKDMGDVYGMADSYSNMGKIAYSIFELDSAKAYYMRALEIRKQIQDQKGLAICYNNLGTLASRMGDDLEAIKYLKKAEEIGLELSSPEDYGITYKAMAQSYGRLGEFERAFRYQVKYDKIRDSIISFQNRKMASELEAEYETEKKELRIASLEEQKAHDKELAKKEQERQQLIIFSVSGGLFLVVVFSIFLFNRVRITRKQNKIIQEQKEEVSRQRDEAEEQRDLVNEKNREILDSINYAKRLQGAILPSPKVVKEYLGESFILYKPKDIVAGDFYWMETYAEASDAKGWSYIAAADCTGHGVPGAMVSVVCSNALSKALIEEGITDTGKLLDRARELVIERFGKSEDEIKDGMDISLAAIRHDGKQVRWSGANNPLWIVKGAGQRSQGEGEHVGSVVREPFDSAQEPPHHDPTNRGQKPEARDSDSDSELIEIKADKQPIGKYEMSKPFTQHTIDLQKGDTLYMFSDGYPDQFGGPKGKKFKSANLKKLLLSIQDKSMQEQKRILDQEFENWRGDLEQIDDVCIVGVRL